MDFLGVPQIITWQWVLGFVMGNALWVVRQMLWQTWVKKSHRYIANENRLEEEKTREKVQFVSEQIGHLANTLVDYTPPLTEEDKQLLKKLIDGDEAVG